MDSSFPPKDEIWFLRVCHHISNAVYNDQQVPLYTKWSKLPVPLISSRIRRPRVCISNRHEISPKLKTVTRVHRTRITLFLCLIFPFRNNMVPVFHIFRTCHKKVLRSGYNSFVCRLLLYLTLNIPSLVRQRCLPSWGPRRTPWFFL